MKRYAIVAVLFLGAVVRLILLNQSFWLDEAAQALESVRPLTQQLNIPADFQPPLYHLLVHFLTLFGQNESLLRMSSVIPGLVTIFVVYLIAQVVWKGNLGKQIGFVAAMFLSLSSLHIFYSQELRPYVFAAMWATLSWYALLQYIDQKKRQYLVMFVIFSIAGMYTMYLYPFLLLSQLAYTYFTAPALRKTFTVSAGIIAVFFLPWIPSFLQQLRVGSELRVTLPGWAAVVSSPQWKALPLIWLKFIGGVQNVDFNIQSVMYFAVPSISVLLVGFLLMKQSKKRQTLQPIVYWLVLPVLAAWLVSFIIPVLSVKRMLLVLPAFYLYIAAAIVQMKNTKWRNYLIAGFALFELIGLLSYWSTPSVQREDWRAIHGQIYDNYSADSTVVVFGFDAPFAPWVWYDRTEQFTLDTLAFPSYPLKEPELSQTMEKSLVYKKVLVFDYLRDLTDPSRQIDTWLLSHGYKEGAIIDTQNLGFVREYQKLDFVSMR